MKEIKIAMFGMNEGNGHPYSWSAMFNGYNKEPMEDCGYPVIPRYLEKQPPETFGYRGAKVTHIWCDDYEDAKKVAKASKIENVVHNMTDVLGEVDAIIIGTDIGSQHVERARPFVEAGLPILVDKPLADNVEDLRTFIKWKKEGAKIASSSSLRYMKELIPYTMSTYELGDLRYINYGMNKTWERYGIHAVEPIYCVTGGGFESVQNTGSGDHNNVVHIKHKKGIDINVPIIYDMSGFPMTIVGTAGSASVRCQDSFTAFKTQLDKFIDYVEFDKEAFPFEETIELMEIIIAGIRSKEEGGRLVMLDEIKEEVER